MTLHQPTISKLIDSVRVPLEPSAEDDPNSALRKLLTQWLQFDQLADPSFNLMAAEDDDYRCRMQAERGRVQARLIGLLAPPCSQRDTAIAVGWTPQNELTLRSLLAEWYTNHQPPVDLRTFDKSYHDRVFNNFWIGELTRFVGSIIRRSHGLEG